MGLFYFEGHVLPSLWALTGTAVTDCQPDEFSDSLTNTKLELTFLHRYMNI